MGGWPSGLDILASFNRRRPFQFFSSPVDGQIEQEKVVLCLGNVLAAK